MPAENQPPAVCPKCGEKFIRASLEGEMYECASVLLPSGNLFQTERCKLIVANQQIATLTESLRVAEEKLAGVEAIAGEWIPRTELLEILHPETKGAKVTTTPPPASDYESLRRELDDLGQQNIQQSAEIARLERENATYHADATEAVQLMIEAQKKRDEFRRAANEAKRELAAITAATAEKDAEIAKLEIDRDNWQASFTRLQAELAALKAKGNA